MRTNKRAQQGRAIEKKKSILASAVELMFTQGLQGVTHRQVAAKANVPVGSIGYYFNTRNELLMHALVNLGESLDRAAAEIVGHMPGGHDLSRAETARLLLDVYLPHHLNELVGWVGVKMDCVRESAELQEALRAQRARTLSHLQQALTKAGNPGLRAELVVLVIEGAVIEAAVAQHETAQDHTLQSLELLLSAA